MDFRSTCSRIRRYDMCSICRSKNCIYRFDVDKWKPEDDLVTIIIPESDSTMLESVRLFEEDMRLEPIAIKQKVLVGKVNLP